MPFKYSRVKWRAFVVVLFNASVQINPKWGSTPQLDQSGDHNLQRPDSRSPQRADGADDPDYQSIQSMPSRANVLGAQQVHVAPTQGAHEGQNHLSQRADGADDPDYQSIQSMPSRANVLGAQQYMWHQHKVHTKGEPIFPNVLTVLDAPEEKKPGIAAICHG